MLNLVILGDSIAKGYGSSEALQGGFGSILGEKLSANVTNLGVVGLDSEQLLDKLSNENYIQAVEEADVICLSIGSNDLLKPFLSIFAGSLGVEGEEKELFSKIQNKMSSSAKNNPLEAADMLSTAMKRLTNNSELNSACQDFPDRFDRVIDRIHEINPDVIIYANNIYNPYYGVVYEYGGISVFNVQQLCEPYIKKLNTTFHSSEDYTVVDMYSVFRQLGYTNVNAASITNMKGINLDPHPNDAGYQRMADYIYTYLDSIAPSVVETEFEAKDNGGNIKISFSEKVRLVAGKKLILQSENNKDIFSYNIETDYWIESEGYILELDLDMFTADDNNENDTLQPGETYVLFAKEGAIKDKGNNHLEEKIMEITMAGEKKDLVAEQKVLSYNLKIKNANGEIIMGIISAVVIVFVIIAILLKRKLNKKTKH